MTSHDVDFVGNLTAISKEAIDADICPVKSMVRERQRSWLPVERYGRTATCTVFDVRTQSMRLVSVISETPSEDDRVKVLRLLDREAKARQGCSRPAELSAAGEGYACTRKTHTDVAVLFPKRMVRVELTGVDTAPTVGQALRFATHASEVADTTK